jgi:ankyrin repeat protein
MDPINELFTLINNKDFIKFKKIIENDTENFIDLNVKDKNNNYLLNYTILYNNKELTELLINKGARIDINDTDDRSILYYPIKFGYKDLIKILVEHNKNNIGISILDIRDKNGNIPLHYAIILKDKETTFLLLEYGSNIYTQDKNGNDALHLAIYSRNNEIINKILEYQINVNDRTNTGESALHIACNLQLVEVVEKLLKFNNIDINAQDNEHQFTPLHYSINNYNLEITKLLLKEGADVNIQDAFGNTILHYIANDSNMEFYYEVKKISKKINYNLWNIDSKIPLHLLLENYEPNYEDLVKDFIVDSNLNIQDNKGNTVLHILCGLNIWKDYKNLLVNKRLDITIKNKSENRPIDLINEKDKEEFINLVIDSYINRLKKNKEKDWHSDWENICKYELSEITEEQKKELNKIKKSKQDFDKVCKILVREKIMETIEKQERCALKTFPRVKGYICPIIGVNGENISVCTFTGSTLDILMGLIYLLKKHKNSCSTANRYFRDNNELCKFYRTMGVTMNSQCEFLNFEIVWVYGKLYFSKEFTEYFNKCIKNDNKRFIIIPIGIEMREGSHSNYIIYDKKLNEIERFEPHGSGTPLGLDYNPKLLDELLEMRFQEINKSIKYISPSQYLPKVGFQLFDIAESKKKKIGDPGGFCALWSIWYVDMRILYGDIPRKKIVKMLIKSIKENNLSFRDMIRNYSREIINIRDTILNKNGVDINDWLMEQLTDEQINNIIVDIIAEINILQ